jgi:hypothetical protein
MRGKVEPKEISVKRLPKFSRNTLRVQEEKSGIKRPVIKSALAQAPRKLRCGS